MRLLTYRRRGAPIERPRSDRPANAHTLRLPTPQRGQSYHEPAVWQTLALRLALPPGSVTLDVLNIPEGCVFVARCACCGGRGEWMADLRATAPSATPAGTNDLIQRYVSVFVDAHASCTVARPSAPLDPRVRARVDDVIAEARNSLLSGRSVPSRIILLTSDGLRTIELPDIPAAALNDGADHRHAIASIHYGVRTLIRQGKLHVHAAIMTQLAWGSSDQRVVRGELTPGEAPDRFQFLLVTVQMANWAGAAMMSLAGRSVDASALLPSSGEPQWVIVGQPSLLIDGMLASPVAAAQT